MQDKNIIDPVSGFQYPDSWVKSDISHEEITSLRKGLTLLTADGTILRRGYTTGTTTAAAAKAAVLSLRNAISGEVTILTPVGIRVPVPVSGDRGHGVCYKYSGDYPGDVTAGIAIHVDAKITHKEIVIKTGLGVGIWERENPRYKKGTPAISPPAYQEIYTAVEEALQDIKGSGAEICIWVEDGEKVASLTLNTRIGVERGISILGSTGFVEPWDDHLEESLIERVLQSQKLVLTTGRIGLRYARILFPGYEVILVGSKIGPALLHAQGEVIICGLPALILKFMDPDFLDGSGYGSIEEMLGTDRFSELAMKTINDFSHRHPGVRVVLLERSGGILLESS